MNMTIASLDTGTVSIIVAALLVLAGIAFFAVFRGKGELEIDVQKGKLKAKGQNPDPETAVQAGVKVSGKAGRDIHAHSTSEGGWM